MGTYFSSQVCSCLKVKLIGKGWLPSAHPSGLQHTLFQAGTQLMFFKNGPWVNSQRCRRNPELLKAQRWKQTGTVSRSREASLLLGREGSLGLELNLARQRGGGRTGTELATSLAFSETSSRASKEPRVRELSQCCLFPVMIYLIKLCLKISLAGGLFSAGPGRGRAQSAAS